MCFDIGLFSTDFKEMLKGGKVKLTQIYRNLLLTEWYRIVEGLKDSKKGICRLKKLKRPFDNSASIFTLPIR